MTRIPPKKEDCVSVPILMPIWKPLFLLFTIKCLANLSKGVGEGTVFKALACCGPPLPGKAIQLFLLYPKLCLCIAIQQQRNKSLHPFQRFQRLELRKNPSHVDLRLGRLLTTCAMASHWGDAIPSDALPDFFLVMLGPHLWATATAMLDPSCGCDLPHSYSNARCLAHWERPGMEPTFSWILVRLVTAEPQW